jgi:spore maturation protein CgeB
MRVQVIYQEEHPGLRERLVGPLAGLEQQGAVSAEFFDINLYPLKALAGVEVIIFFNVKEPAALEIAREAKNRGVRLIFDHSRGADRPEPGRPRDWPRLSEPDVRVAATKQRLWRQMDGLTTDCRSFAESCRHNGRIWVLTDCRSQDWWQVITAVREGLAPEPPSFSGKKILFLAPTFMWPHHYISDILAQNLMDMGHEVRLVTLKPSPFHTQAICRVENFDSDFRRSVLGNFEDPWKIVPLVDREQPDLILTVQGYVISRQILVELRKRRAPLAVWFMDEPYDTSRSCEFGKYFTHVFLQERASLEYHRRWGNPNSYYLPHGCDPRGVQAAAGPENLEMDRAVALVGSPFPRRRELLAALGKEGIEVEVVGNGWEKAEMKRAAPAEAQTGQSPSAAGVRRTMSLLETSRYYRRTRINLTCHRREDEVAASALPLTAVSPNCSVFYLAGSRAFQLVDDSRAELGEFFVPGQEVITYRGAGDCAEKIRYYLEHERERSAVAQAAYARAVREHTYAHRLASLLDTVASEKTIPLDSGHRRLGFIQVGGEAPPAPVPHALAKVSLTVVAEAAPGPDSLANGLRVLTVADGAAFSQALNHALFDTPADYLVVSPGELWREGAALEALLQEFRRDLHLGLILFRNAVGRPTGFLLPARFLLAGGLMRFDNALLAVNDLVYRLRDLGLGVKEMDSQAPALESAFCSQKINPQDQRRFEAEWTLDPEARLRARRLLKLVVDNAWKLTPSEALALAKQAVDLSPTFLAGHKHLGEFYLQQGRAWEALRHLQYVWESDPEDLNSALLYAINLFFCRREDEALAVLQEIIAGPGGDLEKSSAYYQQGVIFKKRQDVAAARRCWEEALRYDPTHRKARQELGMLTDPRPARSWGAGGSDRTLGVDHPDPGLSPAAPEISDQMMGP